MGLHLDKPPLVLGPPSLQPQHLLPEQVSRTLLQSGQMLPEQATPQVISTPFEADSVITTDAGQLSIDNINSSKEVLLGYSILAVPFHSYTKPCLHVLDADPMCSIWPLTHTESIANIATESIANMPANSLVTSLGQCEPAADGLCVGAGPDADGS